MIIPTEDLEAGAQCVDVLLEQITVPCCAECGSKPDVEAIALTLLSAHADTIAATALMGTAREIELVGALQRAVLVAAVALRRLAAL